jgi:PAS domain S-box-containing protein
MTDPFRANQELTQEIAVLKMRIQELEQSEAVREKVEEELFVGRNRLSRAEIVSRCGHWEFDFQSTKVFASEGARRIYGLGDREWTIQEVQNIPLPHYRGMLNEALWELIDENRPYNVKFKIRRPDTGEIVDINSAAEYDRDRNVVFGIIQDITERSQGEEALRWKTALLEAQVNTSIDGILVVDESNRRIITNRRLIDLWDVPRYILDDEDDGALLQYAVGLVKYPKTFIEKITYLYEHPYETSRDEVELGSGMVLDRYSAPVVGEDGHYYGRIWTFHDITERKRMEEEILQSREDLRSLADHLSTIREDEKAKIARELHDELGQSLTAVLIDLRWLRNRLRKDQKALAERINTVATLTKGTIETIKRIQGELRPWMLDNLGLCETMDWQAKRFAERTRIPVTFDWNYDAVIDPKIGIAIFRIFQEALTNVAKHAGATEILVELIQEDREVRLTVSDNGRGIEEAEVHKPLSFGLLGMRERVGAFNGSFIVQGNPGKGTTLRVRIPRNTTR